MSSNIHQKIGSKIGLLCINVNFIFPTMNKTFCFHVPVCVCDHELVTVRVHKVEIPTEKNEKLEISLNKQKTY